MKRGRFLRGLKPLEQTALFHAHKNTVGAEFYGVHFERIAFAIGVAAVLQAEFEVVDRADDLAGAIDKGVHHGGAGMGADVGETIPAFLETTDAEFFAADGYFADIAGRQGDVGDLFGYFMPFEFFKAHVSCLGAAAGHWGATTAQKLYSDLYG